MTEEQYFEQFSGDVAPQKYAMLMVADNDFAFAKSVALDLLRLQQAERDYVGYRYKLDYVHSPGSPFGEHQFHLIEERDIG